MIRPVLHLVSCVSVKLDRPAPARELYCSQWFRFARAHVENEPWIILSAKYGLVRPDQVIEPYEVTLNRMSAQERREWAQRILQDLPKAERYVLWAGERYAEHLAGPLKADRPLQGLGIGQQLSWFKNNKEIST